jgi:hypothetical protein
MLHRLFIWMERPFFEFSRRHLVHRYDVERVPHDPAQVRRWLRMFVFQMGTGVGAIALVGFMLWVELT